MGNEIIRNGGPFASGHDMAKIEGEHLVISDDDFERLIEISKIKIEDRDRERFRDCLGVVVDWLKSLDDISVDSQFEFHPQLKPSSLRLRPDEVGECSVEDALANAPESHMNLFVIGKMKWKE